MIGMVDQGKAYVVPIDFGYKVHDGHLSLYAHSAPEGRKMDILRKNPDITVTLSHSFRIGLGNTPQMWTNAFESVMGDAHVVFLEDFKDRLESIQLLMDRYHMGPIPESVYPTIKYMACYRIDITSMTGKSNLTQKQRDTWGRLETLQKTINDPRTTLQTIRNELDAL